MLVAGFRDTDVRANDAITNPGSPWNLYAYQFETNVLSDFPKVLVRRYQDALQYAVANHYQGSTTWLEYSFDPQCKSAAVVKI